MKVKVTSGDSIHLPEDTYLVVRQKGVHKPYTQLFHVGPEDQKVLTDLPGRPQALFYLLSLRLGFNHIAQMTLEEMQSGAKTGRSQTYEALQRLKEANLVKKVAKDTYKLNPEYVWRGRSDDRRIAIEEWPMVGVKKGKNTPIEGEQGS